MRTKAYPCESSTSRMPAIGMSTSSSLITGSGSAWRSRLRFRFLNRSRLRPPRLSSSYSSPEFPRLAAIGSRSRPPRSWPPSRSCRGAVVAAALVLAALVAAALVPAALVAARPGRGRPDRGVWSRPPWSRPPPSRPDCRGPLVTAARGLVVPAPVPAPPVAALRLAARGLVRPAGRPRGCPAARRRTPGLRPLLGLLAGPAERRPAGLRPAELGPAGVRPLGRPVTAAWSKLSCCPTPPSAPIPPRALAPMPAAAPSPMPGCVCVAGSMASCFRRRVESAPADATRWSEPWLAIPAPGPPCRAWMASTSCPLRIRPAPGIPMDCAIRCSSGRSSEERPVPPRLRDLDVGTPGSLFRQRPRAAPNYRRGRPQKRWARRRGVRLCRSLMVLPWFSAAWVNPLGPSTRYSGPPWGQS